MIKKILPISVFVLVFVVIMLLGLQNMLNKKNISNQPLLIPTIFQGRQNKYTPNPSMSKPKNVDSSTQQQFTPEEVQQKLPIIAPDFTIDYSPRMQRYVVTLKNDDATHVYDNWIAQNPSYFNELQNSIVTKQSIEELHAALDYAKKNQLTPEQQAKQEAQGFTKDLNSLINLPFLFTQSPEQSLSPSPSPSSFPTPTPKKQSLNIIPTFYPTLTTHDALPNTPYVYYSQCDGLYDESPLPQGCTLCQAGCGPTSVAMILSSYVSSSLTPPIVVKNMNDKGVSIGCGGTSVYNIYSYLKKRGDVAVSDFIIPSGKLLSANDIAKDFKGYIDGGWTLLVLANFKTDGGGAHFFWVTDVNNKGDILAYDPYYGKNQSPPVSENRYTPAPYYRYAFAVKKS